MGVSPHRALTPPTFAQCCWCPPPPPPESTTDNGVGVGCGVWADPKCAFFSPKSAPPPHHHHLPGEQGELLQLRQLQRDLSSGRALAVPLQHCGFGVQFPIAVAANAPQHRHRVLWGGGGRKAVRPHIVTHTDPKLRPVRSPKCDPEDPKLCPVERAT